MQATDNIKLEKSRQQDSSLKLTLMLETSFKQSVSKYDK